MLNRFANFILTVCVFSVSSGDLAHERALTSPVFGLSNPDIPLEKHGDPTSLFRVHESSEEVEEEQQRLKNQSALVSDLNSNNFSRGGKALEAAYSQHYEDKEGALSLFPRGPPLLASL